MEVHAHSHTPRKKWTHYFWEFLMLFLAVFCGFLAEYQLEHVIEHNRAKEYAEMLKDDLKKDTAQLNALILGETQILEAQKKAQRVHKMPVNEITWRDIQSLTDPGLDITPFVWNDATYYQMKSSGNLRLFKGKELIRGLGSYESFIKDLAFWENSKQRLLQSDYSFRAEVNEENFINANLTIDHSKPIKSLGYDFGGWREANLIGKRLFHYELTLRQFYPELKKIAVEIIDVLNKEYHLE